jgi:hypothetical protein
MTHDSAALALVPVAARMAPPAAIEGIAMPIGPGWFDSSWDLRRGLEVREESGADAELRAWIEGFVGDHRTSGRIVSPSASTAIA